MRAAEGCAANLGGTMENKDNRPKEIEEEFAEPVITSDDGKKQEAKMPGQAESAKQAAASKKEAKQTSAKNKEAKQTAAPQRETNQAGTANDRKKPENVSENNNGEVKSGWNAKKIVILAAAAVVVAAIAALGIRSLVTGKGLPLVSDPLVYWNANKAVADAEALVNEVNDLEGAVRILDANMDKDTDGTMKELRMQYFYWLSENKQREAYTYIRNYDYVGAAQVLEPIVALNADNAEPTLNSLFNTCINFATSVEWTGDVEHIFFHSLIYDPAKTFVGDDNTQDFNDNYVTVNEFRRILERLYENNFILYDIKQLYSVNEDGSIARRSVYIPEGKRPIILSFDDSCYYDYMKPYGFVQGVDIGADGMPRTFIRNDDGSKVYIEDGDYMPILEKFIKEHPDFTYGGARGTISVTGYEGILGYRTNELDSPEYDQRVQEARAVADGLKALGWTFASHSYGHRTINERDNVWYATDVARWEAEVGPIVGGTDIYMYPGGVVPDSWEDAKHTDMLAHGFRMFCGVYDEPYLEYHDNFAFMERRSVGGLSIREGYLDLLMDMSGILETEVRPQ